MAEVTRVPLQPIAKGSLTKLWIGVIVVLAIAAAVAWATMPGGLRLEVVEEGSGPYVTEDDVVFAEYVGRLDDGTEFDASPDQQVPPQFAELIPDGVPLQVQGVIEGFGQGLLQMREGGSYILEIPSALAYGPNPPQGSPIPPNSDLTFEITVTEIMSQAEMEQRAQQIQAMMGQMQQQIGPDGSMPGDAPPIQ